MTDKTQCDYLQTIVDEWSELIRRGMVHQRQDLDGYAKDHIQRIGLDLVLGGGLKPELYLEMIEYCHNVCKLHYIANCPDC